MSAFQQTGKVEVHYPELEHFCKLYNKKRTSGGDMKAQDIMRAFINAFEPEFPPLLKDADYKMYYLERFCKDNLTVFQYEFSTDILRGQLKPIEEATTTALDRYHKSLVGFILKNLPGFEQPFSEEIHFMGLDHDQVVDMFRSIEVKCS